MQVDRRTLLTLIGASLGTAQLTGCGGGSPTPETPPVSTEPPPAPPPPADPEPPPPGVPEPPAAEPDPEPSPEPDPDPEPPPEAPPLSEEMAALQAYLQSHASQTFSLPASMPVPPTISWAGRVSGAVPASSLPPDGQIIAASSLLIGRPIRDRYTEPLAGNPTVDGFPCFTVNRPYTCKGVGRKIGTVPVLRLKTDAPVVELTGFGVDGNSISNTVIVDGRLVPTKVLACGRGMPGVWTVGTLRLDFGSRALRDIWIETALNVAYIKVDRQALVLASEGSTDPQITVIGDSYLQARSATFGNGGSIGLEIGARLGIRNVAVDAVGGTGYHNSNGGIGNLNDRLPAHSGDNSIVYLVLAGLNDYADSGFGWPSRAVYEESVQGYLRNLRQAQPRSLIVITAPFCPNANESDASIVASATTNSSGLGDFAYRAQVHKTAIQQVAGPWVYIDVLMGGGWLNSSGRSGDITGLQWFTGGTPAPGTTATYKPGNTAGRGGGGFGGIARIDVVDGGRYLQAPDVTAHGGSGQGVLLSSTINAAGEITAINILSPGHGYTDGAGLPTIEIDPTYQTTAAMLGEIGLIVGMNPNGAYPLPSFAPPGATDLNNIYRLLMLDGTHPSPLGVEYLASRLARNIYEAVMAL